MRSSESDHLRSNPAGECGVRCEHSKRERETTRQTRSFYVLAVPGPFKATGINIFRSDWKEW